MVKLKSVLLLPVIAVLALPGEGGVPPTPNGRLTAMQAELGFAIDPHQPVDLHMSMPTSFTLLEGDVEAFPRLA